MLISEYLVEQNIYDIIAKSAVLKWLCEGHLWWNEKRREARTAKRVFMEACHKYFQRIIYFCFVSPVQALQAILRYCSHLFVFLAGNILVRNRPTIHPIRGLPFHTESKQKNQPTSTKNFFISFLRNVAFGMSTISGSAPDPWYLDQ